MSPHRLSRRWKYAAIALVAVTAAGGTLIMRARRNAQVQAPVFETVAVDRGAIRARITATGTVNPVVQVQVGSQVSGTIQALGADFNAIVEPGQMIAQIDPRLFRAAVAQARANLQAARANTHKVRAQLVDSKRQLARSRDLFGQQLIAKATLDTSETSAEVAAALVEQAVAAEAQANAALESASLNLAFTTIRSPIHGTVIARNVDVGQTVAASFAAPTLFVIGEDLTKMVVDTNIAEADVGALAPGMVATFTVDAFPTEVFRGAIRQVRAAPQVIQNVVTYDAVIDVPNPALRLRPGMTANVEIVHAERASVVRVPNAAVRFRPPAAVAGGASIVPPLGKKQVWVLRDGHATPVVFEPGVSDDTYTEVVRGLEPGDRVITDVPEKRASSVGRML